jgi:CTP synthase
MRSELGESNSVLVHVTYVPYIAAAGELKSKPTQHSVKELRMIGLQPDFLVCRSEKPLDEGIKKKISLFCSVEPKNVIAAQDSRFIYEVPLTLHKEGLDELIVEKLKLHSSRMDLSGWKKIVKVLQNPKQTATIGVVGKYVDLKESYKSLNEAVVHAGIANNCKVNIIYVDSEKLTDKNVVQYLGDAEGILVPGGFGARGVEGKISAIKFARERQIPFFGICFGMQLASIEFARNVCGIQDATSHEFFTDTKTRNYVIDTMVEQRGAVNKGGTMRLGSFPCALTKGSRIYEIYKSPLIHERHRHRFEYNNKYRALFEKNGMNATGVCKERNLVEIVELVDHPWFIGVQFHPEFKSKPLAPHPLFVHFVKAALKRGSE